MALTLPLTEGARALNVDDATIARAIAQAVHDEPSIIDELAGFGLPAVLLREFLPPPRPAADVTRAPSGFSDQAYLFWARTHDGFEFAAIVDPGEAT